MKLRWLALFFAAFLLVSPIASADDGSSGSLAEVIEQIVGWILGGQADPGGEPQSITTGDPSELGMLSPPGG